MGGRTGKAVEYIGAAPGATEAGTPQQIVSQTPQGAQQTTAATVSQGAPNQNR